jgi:hypothetical protein
VDICRENKAEAILAVGGGSVIDSGHSDRRLLRGRRMGFLYWQSDARSYTPGRRRAHYPGCGQRVERCLCYHQ